MSSVHDTPHTSTSQSSAGSGVYSDPTTNGNESQTRDTMKRHDVSVAAESGAKSPQSAASSASQATPSPERKAYPYLSLWAPPGYVIEPPRYPPKLKIRRSTTPSDTGTTTAASESVPSQSPEEQQSPILTTTSPLPINPQSDAGPSITATIPLSTESPSQIARTTDAPVAKCDLDKGEIGASPCQNCAALQCVLDEAVSNIARLEDVIQILSRQHATTARPEPAVDDMRLDSAAREIVYLEQILRHTRGELATSKSVMSRLGQEMYASRQRVASGPEIDTNTREEVATGLKSELAAQKNLIAQLVEKLAQAQQYFGTLQASADSNAKLAALEDLKREMNRLEHDVIALRETKVKLEHRAAYAEQKAADLEAEAAFAAPRIHQLESQLEEICTTAATLSGVELSTDEGTPSPTSSKSASETGSISSETSSSPRRRYSMKEMIETSAYGDLPALNLSDAPIGVVSGKPSATWAHVSDMHFACSHGHVS